MTAIRLTSWCRLLHTRKPNVVRGPLLDPHNPEAIQYVGKRKRSPILYYSWGYVPTGALAIRTNSIVSSEPRRIRSVIFTNASKSDLLSCGEGYTLFARSCNVGSDRVYAFGINTYGQLGLPLSAVDTTKTEQGEYDARLQPSRINIPWDSSKDNVVKVTDVSAGKHHSLLAVRDSQQNARVYSFGSNSNFECGREPRSHVLSIDELTLPDEVTYKSGAGLKVKSASSRSFVLDISDGVVYGCGMNNDGQVGVPGTKLVKTATKLVGDLKGRKIVKVEAGSNFCVALDDHGYLYGWGNNEFAQIQKNEDSVITTLESPTFINVTFKVADIAVTDSSCLALSTEGKLYSWGYGYMGHSRNSLEPKLQSYPQPVFLPEEASDSRAVSLTSGFNCFGFINSDKQAYVWGQSVRGGLAPACYGSLSRSGDNKCKVLPYPTRLCLPVDKVIGLKLGFDHGVAVCQPIV